VPLSSTFEADFSAFVEECARATAGLQAMTAQAATTTAALQKMGEVDAGKKIADNADKGAEALRKSDKAGAELWNTIKGVGAAIGISFSVGTIVEWGKQTLANADNLARLSKTLGMTTTELQQMGYAGTQAGSNFEEMVSAAKRLQDAMTSVQGQDAIERLGIDFNTLRAARPADQMRILAEAVGEFGGSQEGLRRVMDLLGRDLGTKVFPVLTKGYADIAAAAQVSGDAQVAAAAEAAQAWTDLKTDVSNASVGIVGNLALAGKQVLDDPSSLINALKFAASGDVIRYLAELRIAAKQTADEIAKAAAGAGGGAGKPAAAPGPTPKELAEQERQLEKARREAEKAAEDLAESEANLAEVRMGAAGITAGIDEAIVQQVRHYLDLGAAQKDLVNVFGLSETAVRSLADAYEQEKDAIELVEGASREAAAERRGRLATTTQAEINAIDAWKAAQLEALQKTKGATDEQYAEIERIAREKLARVGIEWDTLREGSIASLRDQAERARTTYNVMSADAGEYSKIARDGARDIRDATALALASQTDLNEEQKRMIAEGVAGYQDLKAEIEGLPPLLDLVVAGFNKFDFKRWKDEATAATDPLKEMNEIADYMGAYGVTVEEARKQLGLLGDTARPAIDGVTASTDRLSASLLQTAERARSAWESLAAGTALMEAYNRAGVATGMQIATGGYQFDMMKRAGVMPTYGTLERNDTSTPWGRGGATATETNVNIAVSTTDEKKIAEKLVNEMRYQGVRF
jgi:hypothetical protein